MQTKQKNSELLKKLIKKVNRLLEKPKEYNKKQMDYDKYKFYYDNTLKLFIADYLRCINDIFVYCKLGDYNYTNFINGELQNSSIIKEDKDLEKLYKIIDNFDKDTSPIFSKLIKALFNCSDYCKILKTENLMDDETRNNFVRITTRYYLYL